jgi:hypothetical protein
MGGMRSFRLTRSARVALGLGAAWLTLAISIPIATAASAPYTVVGFDDRLETVPPGGGEPTLVTDQYGNEGIVFGPTDVYAFAVDAAPVGLARSGPNVIARCIIAPDGCAGPITWRFLEPQGWVEAWVGMASGHVDIDVLLSAFDDHDVVAAEARVTIPASTGPTPAMIPIWAESGSGATIHRVEVTTTTDRIDGLILDDVAFAQIAPGPDLALMDLRGTTSGTTIDVTGAVANVGVVPVPAFALRIDGPAGSADVPMAALDPGQSAPFEAAADIPAGFVDPFAHLAITAGSDLLDRELNPADNTRTIDVAVPLVATEAPPEPSGTPAPPAPTIAPTVEPSAGSGPPAGSTDLLPVAVGVGALVALAVGGLAWWRSLGARATRPVTDDSTVSIEVDGGHVTATLESEHVTITADDGGQVSIRFQDGEPPSSCPPLTLRNVLNPQCWYAKRELLVEPAGGQVEELRIVVTDRAGAATDSVVSADLLRQILEPGDPKTREARTAAIVRELASVAANLVDSVAGPSRLRVVARVAFLKVPGKVTVYRCAASGQTGMFRPVRSIDHVFGISRPRLLDEIAATTAGDAISGSIQRSIAALRGRRT